MSSMGGMCQVLVGKLLNRLWTEATGIILSVKFVIFFLGQPLDTIKVRLQLDSGRFNGAVDCAVQTIKNEGFLALYKGEASFW
jgi:hypothetical protein